MQGYVKKTYTNEYAIWLLNPFIGKYEPVDVWPTKEGAERQLKKILEGKI